jgi:hypothetical protein
MGAILVAVVLTSSALAQEPLAAKVKISPSSLNLKDKGKWITCTISLPEGSSVADIDVSSILLADTVPAVRGSLDDDVLMVKFSRAAVAEYIKGLPDITFPAQVTLTVKGKLKDGTTEFAGEDTIRATQPGKKK